MRASRIAAGLILALGLGMGAAVTAQAQTELKIGWTNTIDSHYGVGVTTFGDEIAKRTNGRYKLKYFPSGALGGEREMLEAVQLGTQEMIITSTGPVGNFVPETRIVDIPYLFRDYDHARKVLDGPIGQELLTKFPSKGLVAISWMENGFRHITNSKRPVKTPEDVKGLKIRTMENKVHMDAFKAMGALPTPMNMNEVFTALQTGTVDGQENPIPVILANKLYTVQKYVTLDSHVYSPALLIINKDIWNKMSDADKNAFKEAAKIALVANRKKVNDDEANGIDIMKKAGTEVITQVDNAAFQKAVASAYTSFNKEFGEANIKRIMDVK
ncbi:TRAP transporter substrate-binding protein [Propionivibrio soli]|uniref:TRAP transporter substrate-binding protein n=1 Tax=Propionivibrio soli TaxID=2976531 RepID=UPI0021E8C1DD|nr:TRAP transporter substrate-binding protein [Propionivibrio soli]